jgi:hypothetical protein
VGILILKRASRGKMALVLQDPKEAGIERR